MRLVVAGQELALESSEARRKHVGWQGTLLDGYQSIYLYGDEDARVNEDAARLNYAQGSVDTFTAMCFRSPPVMSLKAKTVGDVGKWLIRKDTQATAIDPASGQPMMSPPPTDPATGQPMTDPATGQPVPAQPQPPVQYRVGQEIPEIVAKTLASEFTIHIDAQACREFEQRWFDFKRGETALDAKLRKLPHRLQLHGWVMGVVQWSPRLQQCRVAIHEPHQWFPDPIKEDVSEMSYVELHVPTDVNEAKFYYPSLSKWIDEHGSRSLNYEAPEAPYSTVYQIAYRRPVVTMVYVWLRNQPVYMTQGEAVDRGSLYWKEVGGEDGQTRTLMAKDGGKELDLTDAYDADGSPVRDYEKSQRPHPKLPTKTGIRQWIQTLSKLAQTDDQMEANGKVAEQSDTVCPWPDIPVFLVRNHPICGRPFALGDMEKMRTPLRGVTDLHIAKMKHLSTFRGPMGILARSILDRLQKGFIEGGYMQGGQIGIFDDSKGQLLEDFTKGYLEIKPPPLNEALPSTERTTLEHFDRIAGRPGVFKGEPPAGVTSGVAIADLQSMAAAPETLKTMAIQEATERVMMLIHHAQLHWMSDQEIAAIDRSQPIEILRVIREYSRTLKWGYECEMATGTGMLKAVQEKQVREDAELRCADGNPLTTAKQTRKALNLDHDEIEKELKEAREQQADMARQQQADAQQPAPPPPRQ